MSNNTTSRSSSDSNKEPAWLLNLVEKNPQIPFIAPFMTFLILMAASSLLPDSLKTINYAIRCIGSFYAFWIFRRHYPPMGKPHLLIAIPIGILVAFGWVEIHHYFAGCTHDPCRSLSLLGIDHHFEGFKWYTKHVMFDGNPKDYFIPSEHFQSAAALWIFLIVRIGGASIVVPIIEEIFWRAFMLRQLIDWNRFEEIPLGKFTFYSFIGTSLLSAVQHQPQWEVGILCWLVYNAIFYWKKSLLCCMIMHGVTNLSLYIYVYIAQDWRYW